MSESVQNFLQLFENQVINNPDNIAVIYNDIKISYKQLNNRANAIANHVFNKVGNANLVIGIHVHRGPQYIECILGILKSGNAYMPLDINYPEERLIKMLETSACSCILSDKDKINLKGHFSVINIRNINYDNSFEEIKSPNIQDENLVYVLFTSGSTGLPKGVAMPYKAMNNLINWQINISGLTNGRKTLQYAPFGFDVSFQEIFSTLCCGACLVIADENDRNSPEKIVDIVYNQAIERIFLPNIALQSFVNTALKQKKIFNHLIEVISAGEQLTITPAVKAFFKNSNAHLINQYGPTETHVVTSFFLKNQDVERWPELPPIGKPIINTEIIIINENNEIVKNQEIGEIYIGGTALSSGYINQKELTEERFHFIPHKNVTFYKSGDLGYYNSEGDIVFVGRADEQIKIRGYRIEPAEIEIIIAAFKGIKEVAVKAVELHASIKALAAFYVADEKIFKHQLKAFIASKLPEYMLPTFLIEIEELPKTSSGKTDKKRLLLPVIKRELTNEEFEEANTENEMNLTTLWCSLLFYEKIGINDNVFDLGANSLLCIQASALYEEMYGKCLPVTKIYQYPTVRKMARFLSDENQEKTAKKIKTENESSGDIAVIGIALRFPGAKNQFEFWSNLCNGIESTTFFSDNELDSSISSALTGNEDYIKARGIIDDAEYFDTAFFGINPQLARLMDPQQRKFFEISFECLEDAGYSNILDNNQIGVFAGCGNNSYYLNNVQLYPKLIEQAGDFQVMLMNEKDYIATRTSYLMNLKGPSISIYTACSTSLTAVVQACESLRNNKCEMALAGGSAITSPVKSGFMYNEGSMLSNDGHCRPFDAEAGGTPFSDGLGVVLLKRLEDAKHDNDKIYAVIKGIGINNDGSDKASFTAPSISGQLGALSDAIVDSGLQPDMVSYIETHGTATPIGDPIEIEALSLAYGKNENDARLIGSVKSNFGHLTAAAGVAGLIKTVLMLYNKTLVPTINFKTENPKLKLKEKGLQVNVETKPWENNLSPLRAGVSSFGVGGTNVHVILEEFERNDETDIIKPHLLVFSGKTEAARERNCSNITNYLSFNNNCSIANVSYTLLMARKHFPYRRFIIYDKEKRQHNSNGGIDIHDGKYNGEKYELIFMFPGQGSQFAGMFKSLYFADNHFRKDIDECLSIFKKIKGIDLFPIIFEQENEELLKNTEFAQPSLFITEYCLARLFMNYGILPDAMIGHSVGEFTAASLAGVFSLHDAIYMVANRGAMMQNRPKGKMLAIRYDSKRAEEFVTDKLSLAAVNTSESFVLSGKEEDITELQHSLNKRDIANSVLNTSHAFHSYMMDDVLPEFKNIVDKVELSPPRIPVFSTVTSDWLSDHLAMDKNYWTNHLRVPVLFGDSISKLDTESKKIFLEVGPKAVLSVLVKQQLISKSIPVISFYSSVQTDNDYNNLLRTIGELWLNGINADWDVLLQFKNRKKLSLPPYSFEPQRHWLDISKEELTKKYSEYQDYPTNESKISEVKVHENISVEEIVRNILENSSGINLNGISSKASFFDIGLDSLFLTQIALNLQRKTGVKVSFRQLNEELNNIDALSRFIELNISRKNKLELTQINETLPESELISKVKELLLAKQIDNEQLITQLKTLVSISKNDQINLQENQPFGAIARIDTKQTATIPPQIDKFLQDFISKYTIKTKSSKLYNQKYRKVLADPRVVTGFKPYIKEITYQIVTKKSKGCHLWDIDGNEYIDILNGFGSNFFGYANREINKEIKNLLKKGYEIGPQHHLAGEVAQLISELSGQERVALCNTGSEAVLGIIRIARTISGKSKIVMFNGSYHGINDEVIVRSGRHLKSFPAAPGVPENAVQNALVLDYGENHSLEIIEKYADEIAAVMVEPVQSRRPDFRPFDFLTQLRELTEKKEILLLFDEVITGFRVHPAGVQGIIGVQADLSSYGKVPGGGMPIGIMAGKAQYMDALDGGYWQFGDTSKPEVGVTYFAGTFVRHPLTLASTYASLNILKQKGIALQQELNSKTDLFVKKLNDICENLKIPVKVVNFGSLFRIVFTKDIHYTELLFPLMRNRGIHVLENFPCFLTLSHTDDDLQFIIKAFHDSVKEMKEIGIFDSKSLNLSISGHPPIPGARLGKDPEGNPGWYIPDPDRPGKFVKVE